MAKEQQSLADKLRQRLNDSAGKEIAKIFTSDEDLLQVKNWIQLKPFFKDSTGGPGFPCGHLSMIIGKPDSGKSTLMMEGMVSCQKTGGVVFLIDSEHKFSMARLEKMGGVAKEVVVLSTMTLEEAWTAIDNVLKQAQELREEGFTGPLMMCWDSIAASIPESILSSDAGDAHMALEARMNNKNVRRLRQAISKADVAVVGINHYYMTVPKNPYEISKLVVKGGEELSFLSTLIIKTDQGAKIERTIKGEKQQIGRKTKFTIHKGHFHGRTINKEVNVVETGILESDAELEEYKKSLRGEY